MRRVLFSGALLLLSTGGMVAEAATSDVTLTLEGAIELALSENPTIQVADLEVERYDYVRKTTLGDLMPQLSAEGKYNRTLQSQSMARGFSFGGDQYNTFSATGTLSLALYAPTVYRTLKMNATEAEAAVESARASRVDMVAAVKVGYYNVLLAQHTLDVLQQSADTAKQTVDETQVKFDNGLSSEYDLLTAQVQYSNLQPTILQARTSIDVAKNVLKMYLSLPQDVSITLEADLEQMREVALRSTNNLSRDYYGNTTLRSLALTQEVLAGQLRVNNATRLPTLAAYGQLTYTGNNMDPYTTSTTTTTTTSEYFWQSPASAGLTLSVPIFSGFTKSSRSRQIENQIKQLELQRRYAEQNVGVDLTTAIDNIDTSREKYLVEQKTVSQAQKAYDISETRYNAGAGTILELNTSRLALTQAELNLSQAMFDLLSAKCEYDKVMGLQSTNIW